MRVGAGVGRQHPQREFHEIPRAAVGGPGSVRGRGWPLIEVMMHRVWMKDAAQQRLVQPVQGAGVADDHFRDRLLRQQCLQRVVHVSHEDQLLKL